MIVTFLKFLLGVSASLYALLLLLVYCYQDLLVFPGSVIPIQAPSVRGVVEERLALKDGRTFRVAIARPKSIKRLTRRPVDVFALMRPAIERSRSNDAVRG